MVALFSGLVGAVLGTTSTALLRGDERALIAAARASVGGGDLALRARGDINLTAHHIRLVGRDGNFEFEHGAGSPVSLLNAYVLGTGMRTPIQIGGDDQDVLALRVRGRYDQEHDLQQWSAGRRVNVAVDGRGYLRLGLVTLSTRLRGGRVLLVAELPDGSRTVLASALARCRGAAR